MYVCTYYSLSKSILQNEYNFSLFKEIILFYNVFMKKWFILYYNNLNVSQGLLFMHLMVYLFSYVIYTPNCSTSSQNCLTNNLSTHTY